MEEFSHVTTGLHALRSSLGIDYSVIALFVYVTLVIKKSPNSKFFEVFSDLNYYTIESLLMWKSKVLSYSSPNPH